MREDGRLAFLLANRDDCEQNARLHLKRYLGSAEVWDGDRLLNHLVGADKDRRRDGEAERSGTLEVDRQDEWTNRPGLEIHSSEGGAGPW